MRATMSVSDRAIRLEGDNQAPQEGNPLRYALVVYNDAEAREQRSEEQQQRINAGILEVLERPTVSGWLRLRDVESATTVRSEHGKTLLTDGPFVDSKDYLGGFIIVEAENLDGALAVASELQELRDCEGAIEVRPVNDAPPGSA